MRYLQRLEHGATLRNLRTAKNWSARWVGEQVGVSARTILNWENAVTWPQKVKQLALWEHVLEYQDAEKETQQLKNEQTANNIRALAKKVNGVKVRLKSAYTVPQPEPEQSQNNTTEQSQSKINTEDFRPAPFRVTFSNADTP